MYIADQEVFSPDKLRASIERLYMTVIVGMLAAWKQIARIRSWKERRRTACFCFVRYCLGDECAMDAILIGRRHTTRRGLSTCWSHYTA